MAILPKSPTTDFASTTLNGNIDNSVLTITVNNAGAIQTPTYAVIDRLDANSVLTPNAREMVYISSKAGNDLTVTRGVNNSTARAHNSGAILEPILSVGQWTDLYSWVTAEHSAGDGTHDITKIAMLSGATVQTLANKILSSPTIALGSLSSVLVSQATIQRLTITNSAFASGASLIGFFPSGASGSILASRGNSETPVFIANSTNPPVVDSDVVAADTISSATYANISGADVSVTTSVTSNIFIISTTNAYAGSITEAYYRLFDGSAIVGAEQRLTHLAGNYRRTCTIIAVDANKAAGTYTYTTQHHSDGSNTITAENCSMVAIALPV